MRIILIIACVITTIIATVKECKQYKSIDFSSTAKYYIYILSNALFIAMLALFVYCLFVPVVMYLFIPIFLVFNFSIALMSVYVEDLVRNGKRQIYVNLNTLRILRTILFIIVGIVAIACLIKISQH